MRILEVTGMHRATGGSEYTGLQPGRIGHIDMTHAVLDVLKGPCHQMVAAGNN